MQTALSDFVRDTPEGREADEILRKCVHCGFCNATCPTYQLLGDELDGPRGRIYLIKQALEGHAVSAKTRLHLDRCLTCRSCETTCPSGVRYHRLLDIGREVIEERAPRPWHERLLRRLLRLVLPHSGRFAALLWLGRTVKPILPQALQRKIPPSRAGGAWPAPGRNRTMLVLDGCVQPAIAPQINAASARVLDRLGISLQRVPGAACCGAVSHHLSAHDEGLAQMRRNIDAWWPALESGAEAIVITASACATMVKAYGELLRGDPKYAEKAARVSALTRDIAEVLANEDLDPLRQTAASRPRIAFHSPCTLQHAERVVGVVEQILLRLGFALTPVADGHLCCGSAGTYSILQQTLSTQLLSNKLSCLQAGKPDVIATANIGCLAHLATEAHVPVCHWIELVDPQSA
ncbi:MAG: glycolate oxidase subunit GlcF [Gammaproteobacteria bacterium]